VQYTTMQWHEFTPSFIVMSARPMRSASASAHTNTVLRSQSDVRGRWEYSGFPGAGPHWLEYYGDKIGKK
jgi:hypothetical protein